MSAPLPPGYVPGMEGSSASPAAGAPSGPSWVDVLSTKVSGLSERVRSLDGWAKLSVAMAGLALLTAGIALMV